MACDTTGPGTIPPPRPTANPVPPKLPPIRLQLRDLGVDRHRHALVLELRASHGTLTELELDLTHGAKRVARELVAKVSHAEQRLLVRVHGKPPRRGRYEITVRQGHRVLARRRITIR
jgi:hypothetical protein